MYSKNTSKASGPVVLSKPKKYQIFFILMFFKEICITFTPLESSFQSKYDKIALQIYQAKAFSLFLHMNVASLSNKIL